MGKQREAKLIEEKSKLMHRIDKLEEELDIFNKKHRELKAKYKLALELIQKIDPTKKITQ